MKKKVTDTFLISVAYYKQCTLQDSWNDQQILLSCQNIHRAAGCTQDPPVYEG